MALAAETLFRRLIDLDAALSLRVHTAFLPVPRALLKAFEISGDGRLWFPVSLALIPLSSPQFSPLVLSLLAGLILDLLLVGLIKALVRRPRPLYNKGMGLTFAVDHWSFPSGHSSRVFFLVAFLHLSSASIAPLLLSHGNALLWIGNYYGREAVEPLVMVVFVWSVTTSFSRVLLGRHFVFDVVAGSCLGVLEALIVFYFLDTKILYDCFLGKWFPFS